MAWVVLTLCQLAVTVAGNLAVIPLTGVTFPFVSFGMTSLVVNCRDARALPERQRAGAAHDERGRRRCSNSRIAASVAVVPVLLGVLLLVAWLRPLADDADRRARAAIAT